MQFLYSYNAYGLDKHDVKLQSFMFSSKYGHTALHITALQKEPCHVPDLMAAGINPDLKDFSGRSALQLAKNQTKWIDLYNKYEVGLFLFLGFLC